MSIAIAPADLTWEDLKKASPADFRLMLSKDEYRKRIDEILAAEKAKKAAEEAAPVVEETPNTEEIVGEVPSTEEPVGEVATLTPEEEAAAEEARRQAEELAAEEARKQAEEQARAEAARKVAEEQARPTPEKKRFVLDFQAKDEDGNPIGNRTHLEADTQEELQQKMLNSYENAVRAINRLKKQRPTFRKDAEPVVTISEADIAAASEDLTSDDPAARAAAVRKIVAAETQKERQEAALAAENARQEKEAFAFMQRHITDYNRCSANGQILSQYLQDNNLEFTADNLEIAFDNCESLLAPVPRSAPVVNEPAPSAVVNPTVAAAPAAAPAVAQPAAAPVAPAPAAPAAAAPAASAAPAPARVNIPAPAPARRPGVNGGLIPGQNTTSVKTAPKVPELSKKDIAKMSAEEMRRRAKIDPKFYEKVNALFAK